jgi:hypothetical protein
LAEIIRRHDLERLLYLGAGSATLMPGNDFTSLGHYLGMAWNMVVTNNRYSSDFAAFVPGQALLQVQPPAKDNLLPRVLHDEAALSLQELPRSVATQFNIDTPSDMAVLKLIGKAGPRLSVWLAAAEIDCARYEVCLSFLTDPNAQVLIAGRIGSQAWQYLERETACRIRLFSEERGMRAEGREHGKARSLLAYHLQEVGAERFFAEIAEMVDAAFIDSRVSSPTCRRTSRAPTASCPTRATTRFKTFLRDFTEAA